MKFRGFLIGVAVSVVIFASFTSGAVADRLFGLKPLDNLFPKGTPSEAVTVNQKIVKEESLVVDVAARVSPSVVTVSAESPRRSVLEFDPFGGFRRRTQGGVPQDIGSGFIISSDGLIVTNRHVVDDSEVTYTVVSQDGAEYEVIEISKDPSNDLAIIRIDPSSNSDQPLVPVELGDSNNLKVGQIVIAIGTALGEFRHTVTTGVVSGLGRGINAGTPFRGFVERLDDVIQTDAAINPGNSGGPLLNSAGQVIGVNVAVASGAENIGFAIPIDIIKKGLEEFQATGQFASRPFLGIQYQMLSREAALLNEVPEGAYVLDVVDGSPAKKAGLETEDIITKIDGVSLNEDQDLASVISDKKVGQKVNIELFRDGATVKLDATLSEFGE